MPLPTLTPGARAVARDDDQGPSHARNEPVGAAGQNLAQLKAWDTRRIEQITGQRSAFTSQGKAIPAPTKKRLEQIEDEEQALRKEQHQWRQEGVRTNPGTYLRFVAVLVPA